MPAVFLVKTNAKSPPGEQSPGLLSDEERLIDRSRLGLKSPPRAGDGKMRALPS